MTADLATLRALKERCEAAAGSDRELDHDLIVHFAGSGNLMAMLRHYPLTSSIDAALALVERVLPGAGYDLDYVPGGDPLCGCRIFQDDVLGNASGEGATLPLAALSALFDALISRAAALISRAEEARQS